MMKKNGWKLSALALAAALCLSLTGCYAPEDQVTDDTGISLNNNNQPWQTVNPTTPTPVPTAVPVRQTDPSGSVTSNPGSIVLTTATPVSNLPGTVTINPYQGPVATPTMKAITPTPTAFLFKKGSKGDTVKTIQNRLKELGYLTGSADGDFGASTETAVKNFQTTNGLTADGQVGQTTYAKLMAKSALPAGATPTPKTITTLKEGSKGASVRSVQTQLKKLGYYKGTVDGSFGATTTAAVKEFQRKNGLTVDGKVGTTTWNRLFSSSALSATATATPTGGLSTVLKVGSTGANVATAQSRLRTLGYYKGVADGIFGSTTEAAVKAFQTRNGLKADGQIGNDTWLKLQSSSAKPAQGVATPTATGKATATPRPSTLVAQRGDQNDTVKAIQLRLKELKYLSTDATGYYGDATEAAVKRFQANNKLKETGVVDVTTQKVLNSAKAIGLNGVTAKPTATPVAQKGSSGDTVKSIQQRLKDLGYFNDKVTGNYGAVTTAAVKAFQKGNSLTETGICDSSTYNLLMSAKAKAASTATPKPTATPDSRVVVKLGDKGEVVKQVQQRLKDLGYFKDGVTGNYGSVTASAMKAFQTANKLTATGTCDQTTYNLLMSSRAKGLGTATPKPTATPASAVIAKKGDSNSIVTSLQQRLKELGYFTETVTGNYGNSTVTAMKAFQVANKLSDTGICDQNTYNLLMSNKAKGKPTATPKATATPDARIIAKKGDSNEIVRQLQTRLVTLGYLKGTANGTYGTSTVSAMKEFQQNNGLAATGSCDQSTYDCLMGSKAKAKVTATPATKVIAQRGSKGSTVTAIQTRLKELGYFTDAVTGNYGAVTEAAMKEFQQTNKLTVTGICDETTYNLLISSKAKAKGNATPTPATDVIAKQGSTGTVVKEIQERLKTLGYFTGTTSTTYGPKTREAVEAFQSTNSLTVDGVVNKKTYDLLMSSKAKAKPTATGDIIAQKGDSGAKVKEIQQRLKDLGYMTANATGTYADRTVEAVTAFQSSNSLTVTGVVNKKTYDLLMSSKAKAKSTAAPTPTGSIMCREGETSAIVREVQERLRALGYMTASATGTYADKTREAVMDFQGANGLSYANYVDRATYNLLMSSKAKAKPSATPTATISGTVYLKRGDSGSVNLPKGVGDGSFTVYELQSWLKSYGFYTGSCTNTYDAATETAVKAFQKKNGITASGKLDQQTYTMLFSSNAKYKDDTYPHGHGNDYEILASKGFSGSFCAEFNGEEYEQNFTVKMLQQYLNKLGYFKGNYSMYFGETTEAAVKAFQQDHGLVASGVLTQGTYRKLRDLVHGTATATPSGDIIAKQGSTGALVKEIQEQLKTLGYFTGTTTNTFGTKTANAVQDFQTVNGLTANGVVNKKTYDLLMSGKAKAKPTATTTATSDIIAKEGSTGTVVKEIQERLKTLGYFTGNTTTTYGTKTVDAVREFQSQNGLTVNGIVNKKTYDLLMSSKAKAKPAAAPTPSGDIIAQEGDSGTLVKDIQERLKTLGYFTGTCTGVFVKGGKTTQAVRDFQTANGLSVDGVVNKKTYDLLMSSKAKVKATATPTATTSGTVYLKRGDSGSVDLPKGVGDGSFTVYELQSWLKSYGFYTGSCTNTYDAATETAVKAFQKKNGITASGKLDQQTYTMLFSSNAKYKDDTYPHGHGNDYEILASKGFSGSFCAEFNGEEYEQNFTVKMLQQYLNKLGYFKGNYSMYFGETTEAAVKAFQQDHGLVASGVLTQGTYRKLRDLVHGTATATPSGDIIAKEGSTGTVVKEIQERLKTLGYFTGNTTTTYGTKTVDAVREFQSQNGLTVNGIVNKKTYDLLMSSKAKAKATAAPTPSGDIIAQEGDSGALVKSIQERLKALDYFTGTCTGVFAKGGKTTQAVRDFQTANGLPVNGVVNKKTYDLLMSSKAKAKPTATPTPTAVSDIVAREGDHGEVVKTIQERLKTLGYFTGTTTTSFGTKTKSAVEQFQAQNGLTVTGIVNKKTYDTLMSSKAKPLSTATPTPIPASQVVAKKGDKGEVVSQIQTRLIALYYMTGSATGNYGDTTLGAVKEFQSLNGLTVTGVVDKTTYNLLLSSKAKAKPHNATAKPRTDIYLQQGDRNANVTKLQNRLIELGYMLGKASGTYNGATVAAVEAYQKRAGLWQDSIAGPQTLESIYGDKAPTTTTAASVCGVTLSASSQGTEVKVLQTRLKALGYLTSAANGSYGEMTVEAVKAFQKDNSLKETGTADTKTLDALFDPTAKAKSSKSAVVPTATAVPAASVKPAQASRAVVTIGTFSTLRSGDQKSSVTDLQNALRTQGYLTAKATGNYATKTVDAVKSFQADHGLRVTGIAGPATQRILFGVSYAGSTTVLKQGSTGADVAELQYTLWELGYYEGEINGVFGQSTADAVTAFQTANGVKPVNGQVAAKTRTALYGTNPVGAN